MSKQSSNKTEMLADIESFDIAKAKLKRKADEIIPISIIERRLKGESPVKIWREYRGLTQENLAKKARITRSLLAAIETTTKTGSVSTLTALARALGVSLENLLRSE